MPRSFGVYGICSFCSQSDVQTLARPDRPVQGVNHFATSRSASALLTTQVGRGHYGLQFMLHNTDGYHTQKS